MQTIYRLCRERNQRQWAAHYNELWQNSMGPLSFSTSSSLQFEVVRCAALWTFSVLGAPSLSLMDALALAACCLAFESEGQCWLYSFRLW